MITPPPYSHSPIKTSLYSLPPLQQQHKMHTSIAITTMLLLTLLSTSPPLIHSRKPPQQQQTKTTVFDISASLRNTLTATPNQQTLTSLSLSSPMSLTLHSRKSIQKLPHTDYKSLTLSRLARDSARVKSLSNRLDLATGLSKSDLKINPLLSQSKNLASPIVSGTSQGSGEYFSRVGIGNPPSQTYMVLDTGSDVSWLQCAPCGNCYQQSDPIFEPSASSSYSPLTCDARQCDSLDVSECHNHRCLYEVSYGDGSYTFGDFVTETVSLGSTTVENVAIGCGHNNEGLFVGAAGLLGLGGGALSFPSQVKSTSFSYCLVDRDSDSASTLDFDSPLSPNAVTAPLISNKLLDTFYYLGLRGISVGGEPLPLTPSAFEIDESGNGGIIIDSGTAVTRLQEETYNLLRDSFLNRTTSLPKSDGVALFDTCYNLESMSSVEVPTVSFHFGESASEVLQLPAKNYMIPVDSNGTFCLAFAPTISSLSIIGNVQQQGIRVGFDVGNSRVGFTPNQC